MREMSRLSTGRTQSRLDIIFTVIDIVLFLTINTTHYALTACRYL